MSVDMREYIGKIDMIDLNIDMFDGIPIGTYYIVYYSIYIVRYTIVYRTIYIYYSTYYLL